MFQTIVHQALKDEDNPDYIEEHGPFPGDSTNKLYLGEGSYFWDDHIELAHWWGDKHIVGNYVICEGKLKVDKIDFLDLVGCRQDMIHLKEMIKKLNIGHLKLGEAIEFLKKINYKLGNTQAFPYKVIRAVDVSPTSYSQEWISFATDKKGYTSLTPVYLICLIEKSNVLLSHYRIIFPDHYVNGN